MPSDALTAALAGFAPAARFGVAVSGGGDSVAALVLAVQALGAPRVAAATVDHGLRPGSAQEAAGVAALCARLGVAHRTLVWAGAGAGAKARGNRMDAARRGRSDLLADWALAEGLAAVILAHTQDDQAETLLMRLARGSGVDGLSAMAPARRDRGVLWLRPFLDVSRAGLRAVLQAQGLAWVEDPTNADPRFQRTRARAALAALAPLGIGAAALAATAARLTGTRAVLDGLAAEALARWATEDRGVVTLDAAALDLAADTRDRLLGGLVRDLAQAPYRPRLADLHRALDRIAAPGGSATLGGVVLVRRGPEVALWREPRAVVGHGVDAGAVWDGRWRAAGPAVPGARIAALGPAGPSALRRLARAGGLPAAALPGLPAIWRGAELIAAPLHGWPQGWTLRARPRVAPPPPAGAGISD